MNQDKSTNLDLDDLLHPARAFEGPSDVVNDADLTPNEKRAILASWASDACAIEAAPALRQVLPDGTLVSYDEVMDALRALDKQVQDTQSHHWRRRIRRERMSGRGHGSQTEQESPRQ